MPRNKVARALTLEREKRVWEMRQHGVTYEHIANEIGISFYGVDKILQRLHKRYYDSIMNDIAKIKMEQIAALNHVADEAFRAWEHSKLNHSSSGDPRFLVVFMKALEGIRKITDADAPIKSEHKTETSVEAHKITAQKELQKIMDAILNEPYQAIT